MPGRKPLSQRLSEENIDAIVCSRKRLKKIRKKVNHEARTAPAFRKPYLEEAARSATAWLEFQPALLKAMRSITARGGYPELDFRGPTMSRFTEMYLALYDSGSSDEEESEYEFVEDQNINRDPSDQDDAGAGQGNVTF